MMPFSEMDALAQFYINVHDIPFFQSGIMKIRLSTLPIVHETSFLEDQIGVRLYNELTKVQADADDF